MNIHFEEEKIFNELMESSLFQIAVGSHLYGLNNEKSDTDLMIIYAEPIVNSFSLFSTNHQLQFKRDNVDYIFLSLNQFINNILSGDSTINYEVLYSDKLKNDKDLKFLYDNKNIFDNYNIVKSYLGIAKRDLADIKKKKQYSGKKASHVLRGIMMAEAILENEDIRNIYSGDRFNRLQYLKSETTSIEDKNVRKLLNFYQKKMEILREINNNQLNDRKIVKILSSENAFKLNQFIFDFVQKERFLGVQKKFIDFGSLIEYGIFSEKMNYKKN